MLASLSGRRLLQCVALVAVVAIVPVRSVRAARVAHPVPVAPNEVRVPYFGAAHDGKCPARTRERVRALMEGASWTQFAHAPSAANRTCK
jgi:hypothetical protein